MTEDFNTADEPDLGQDDDQPSELPHRLRHLAMRFEKIGFSLKRMAIIWEIDDMDFTNFDAAVAELTVLAAASESTISGDVAAAVAAQAAADATSTSAAISSAVSSQLSTDQSELDVATTSLQAVVSSLSQTATSAAPPTVGISSSLTESGAGSGDVGVSTSLTE